MMRHQLSSLLQRIGPSLAISSLTVLTFLIQYWLRIYDDNRLTSWNWAFAGVTMHWFVLMVFVGTLLAFIVSRFSLPSRRTGALLFAASFTASAAFWGAPESIVDASRYFIQAKHLSLHGFSFFFQEWGRDIPAWTDLPLAPFLYGSVFRLFGESRMYVQVFTTLLFSLTTVLAYRIGRDLYDGETGLYAGLFFLACPLVFLQTSLLLVDVPAMFFLMLAIHAVIGVIMRGGPLRMALAAASVFLAVLTKYSLWMMLSVLAVIPAVGGVRGAGLTLRDRAQRTVWVFALSAALIGVFVLMKFDVFADQIGLLLTFQGPGIRRWGESFLSTFFFQLHPFVTIAAILAVGTAYVKKDRSLLILLFLPAMALLFRIERSRYLIPILPMVAIMAAYWLRHFAKLDRKAKQFLVLSSVCASLVVAHPGFFLFLQRTSAVNLQHAGAFLDSLGRDVVEVRTVPHRNDEFNSAVLVPILDIYTKTTLVYRYDPPVIPVDVETSRLRFTWEYRNPAYYRDTEGRPPRTALAVITRSMAGDLQPDTPPHHNGFSNKKTFDAYEGIFQFRTSVAVYW